ncbi:MAG: hypothetical protein AAF530_25160, partial [Pseudomonadota bacterium]
PLHASPALLIDSLKVPHKEPAKDLALDAASSSTVRLEKGHMFQGGHVSAMQPTAASSLFLANPAMR